MKYFYSLLILSIFLFGCNEEFSPTGVLEKNYAVYCVLDNRLENQLVRVHPIYLNESLKKMPQGTRVVLSENLGENIYLRDTLIPTMGDYSFYYMPTSKLKRGRTYRLSVISDPYSVQWADTYVFPVPTPFYVDSNFYIDYERAGMVWEHIVCFTAPATEVYLLQMYIEYEYISQGKVYINKVEVPVSHKLNIEVLPGMERHPYEYDKDLVTPFYPGIIVINKSWYQQHANEMRRITWTHDYILWVLRWLSFSGEKKDVTIKGAFVVFTSIDRSLYDNFIKGQKAKYSFRLDEPYHLTNFLNLSGEGIGYFSCITADTVYFKIFNQLATWYGYKDGQN